MRVQKLKIFFSNHSNFINNFLIIIILAVVFVTNGFFISDAYAESESITKSFTVTSGEDASGDASELFSQSDITKLTTSDDQRIQSNGTTWPVGESYDESKYIEFIFSPDIPSDAEIDNIIVKNEFRRSGALTGAKLEIYDGESFQDYSLTPGKISEDHIDEINITDELNSPDKVNNFKARFLAYRGEGGNTKTSHDFISLEVTYHIPDASGGDTGGGGDGGTGGDNGGGQGSIYTEVTGDISNDTTWTKENSPYVVNSFISILPGVILNINEGVIVKFGSDGGLFVNGVLNVSGTESDKVLFTSINDDTSGGDIGGDKDNVMPDNGDWRYIFFDSDLESNLNNLIIKYSNEGIVLYYDTPIFINNLTSDEKITMMGVSGNFNNLNVAGLDIFDHSNVIIENSNIYNDSHYVVSLYDGSSLDLKNSNVGGRGDSIAIFNASNVSLSNSNIYSYQNSIHSAVSVFNNSNLNVSNSKFECAYDCIWVHSNSSLDLSGSVISGLHDGIDIYNNENKNINITDTKISNSMNAGLMIFGNTGGAIKIDKSEIYENAYGFIVFDSPILVNGNSIHDNFEAGAITYTETDLDFVSNYWGDKTGPTHSSNASGLGDLISDHILYSPFLPYDPLSDNVRNPVILIPGITGTYLYKDYGDHEEIWPDVAKMFISISDDYLNDLILNEDGTENIEFPIVSGDIIRGISTVHIFDLLIDRLKANGYIEGEDLFVFPYDWRFSTTRSADELKGKIDKVITDTGYQKVDIIAHSMGGLVAKKYIADNGSDKVDQLIFLGTPQLGSPKAFKTLMFGDDMSYKFLIMRLNPQKAKYISQNMPAVYELLPSKKYINLNNSYVLEDNIDTKVPLDYEQTKEQMITNGRNPLMFPFAESLHDSIDYLNLSNIKTYNFVGCASETIGRVSTSEEKSWIKNIFGKKIDNQIQYIDGDGTVPLISANKTIGSEMYYVSGVSHGSLPASTSVINWIISILGGPQTQFDDTVQDSNRYCGIKGDVLSVHSPVEIHVYDEDGNHVGPNENGDIEYGIPGISYDVLDDVKYVFLPKGKNYKIVMKALDTGGFNLSVESQSGEDILGTHNWTLIPLRSVNSSGEVFIGPDYSSDKYVVKMDDDGDGHFDENYKEGFDGTREAEKATQTSSHIVSGSIFPIQNILTKIPMIEKTFPNNFTNNLVKLSIANNTEKISNITKQQEEPSLKPINNYKAEVASTSTKVKLIFPVVIFSVLLIILLAKMFIKL